MTSGLLGSVASRVGRKEVSSVSSLLVEQKVPSGVTRQYLVTDVHFLIFVVPYSFF